MDQDQPAIRGDSTPPMAGGAAAAAAATPPPPPPAPMPRPTHRASALGARAPPPAFDQSLLFLPPHPLYFRPGIDGPLPVGMMPPIPSGASLPYPFGPLSMSASAGVPAGAQTHAMSLSAAFPMSASSSESATEIEAVEALQKLANTKVLMSPLPVASPPPKIRGATGERKKKKKVTKKVGKPAAEEMKAKPAPKRKSRGRRPMPARATEILNAWFFGHIDDPYPSYEDKLMLGQETGLTEVQINYWFCNKRMRLKRKMNLAGTTAPFESAAALRQAQARAHAHPNEKAPDRPGPETAPPQGADPTALALAQMVAPQLSALQFAALYGIPQQQQQQQQQQQPLPSQTRTQTQTPTGWPSMGSLQANSALFSALTAAAKASS